MTIPNKKTREAAIDFVLASIQFSQHQCDWAFAERETFGAANPNGHFYPKQPTSQQELRSRLPMFGV